jgi:2-amino-4-hydroxy-6-hydroxymethyldihydropteridine diphosphokinase
MCAMRVVVGVGGNLGDRWANVDRAIERLGKLPGVVSLHRSRWFETDPVGGPEQPQFLNGAVLLELDREVPAVDLVDQLLDIERALGRVRGSERNGPRVIDLDILWTDGAPSTDPRALVPHPRLTERAFALAPLVDVCPDARDPAGISYADHLARLGVVGIRSATRPPS